MMNSSTDGIGLRIDHDETFSTRSLRRGALAVEAFSALALPGGASTTRTMSPSLRKPPPEATTRAFCVEAAGDLDAIAGAAPDLHLGLADLRVRRRRA